MCAIVHTLRDLRTMIDCVCNIFVYFYYLCENKFVDVVRINGLFVLLLSISISAHRHDKAKQRWMDYCQYFQHSSSVIHPCDLCVCVCAVPMDDFYVCCFSFVQDESLLIEEPNSDCLVAF